MRRAFVLPVLLGALMLGPLAQPSVAENSWSGSCAFDNYTDFWPAHTMVPEPSGYYAHGTGHCKGKLNGKPFDGTAEIQAWANMHTDMSCTVGLGPNAGPAYLIFKTGAARAAGSSGAAGAQRSATKPARRYRKHSRHKARHKGKRARRAAPARRATARAASSDPPRDPSQPVPRPPIPDTPEPTLEVWLDVVSTAPNLIFSDMHGAYRGHALGAGTWTGNLDSLKQCLGDGIPGSPSKVTWTTVTELLG
jgi:hypothetical protein